jgi:hypothetical protein
MSRAGVISGVRRYSRGGISGFFLTPCAGIWALILRLLHYLRERRNWDIPCNTRPLTFHLQRPSSLFKFYLLISLTPFADVYLVLNTTSTNYPYRKSGSHIREGKAAIQGTPDRHSIRASINDTDSKSASPHRQRVNACLPKSN